MDKHQSIMERYESGYPTDIDRKAFFINQINKAIEDLRECDPTAWREQFLAWLNDGELDVSVYEFVGEG